MLINNYMRNKNIANFFFEVGSLKRILRSSWQMFLDDGETIAEHSFITTIIGYVLALLEKEAGNEIDENKVLKMCLFHDLPETRTGDQNVLHQKYVRAYEDEAIEDQYKDLFCGDELKSVLKEYNEGKYDQEKSLEAVITKEADILEQLLHEKESQEKGNTYAAEWMEYSRNRLKTENGKKIAEEIINGSSRNWWYDMAVEKKSK